MNELKMREEISLRLRQSMPLFISDDLDEYFYLVRSNEVGVVVEAIIGLLKDIRDKKPYAMDILLDPETD